MGDPEKPILPLPKAGAPPVLASMALARHGTRAGSVIMQVAVAIALLGMVMVGTTQAFLVAHRHSAEMRLLTAARAIVQRNIDEVLSVTFTSNDEPATLAITSASGVVYDDDGSGDNTIKVATQDDNAIVTTKGTMTRIVTAVANTENAIIRQVTFRLSYDYRGRTRTVQMTTMRAIDD